jgi:hypothetical protein
MMGCLFGFSNSGTLFLVAAWMCIFACGCQRNVVPVSGRVTLNGKPLAGAVVTFQPLADRESPRPEATGSTGRTDGDGRFALRLVDPDRPGAAVGDHIVTVSMATGGSDAAPSKGQPLPKDWRDGSKRFRVPPGGTSEANFDIAGR